MAADRKTTVPADDGQRVPTKLVRGQPTSDGAGVKLTRVIGTQVLPQLDPFLLLDEFGSEDPSAYIAGFPNHPHRGFETVTYMLEGRMRHRDNKGNEGVLESGGVQWMTVGRRRSGNRSPTSARTPRSTSRTWGPRFTAAASIRSSSARPPRRTW